MGRKPKAWSIGSGKTYYPALTEPWYFTWKQQESEGSTIQGVLLLLGGLVRRSRHQAWFTDIKKSNAFFQGRPQRTTGWQHRHPQRSSSGWPWPGYAKSPHNYSCKNLCFHIPCHLGVECAKFIKFVPKTEEVHSWKEAVPSRSLRPGLGDLCEGLFFRGCNDRTKNGYKLQKTRFK